MSTLTSIFKMSLPVVLLACTAALLAGCPEGVVRDGVVVLDQVAGVTVSQVTADGIELLSKVDTPIAVGDVIVSKEGGGILRRVTSVGQKGEAIAAKTESATLEDAVESGTMVTSFGFTPQNFADSGVATKDAKSTLIDFSGKTIYNDYGIDISVDKGTVECAPNFFMNATWANNKLDTFDLTTSGDIKVNLDVKIGVSDAQYLHGEWNIIKPVYLPFYTQIGPVPVYGHVALTLPFGVYGDVGQNTWVKSGLDITDTFVIDSHYANGDWGQTTFDADNFVVNGHPLCWNIDIGGSATMYVKVALEVSLYEMVNGNVYVRPYAYVPFHIFPSPASVSVTAGFNAGAGFNLGALGLNIYSYEYNWPGMSWLLYSASQEYSDPIPWTSGCVELW